MKKIIIYLLCLSFLFAFGCDGDNSNPLIHVIYSVHGIFTTHADINYCNIYGSWTINDAKLPWSHTFDAPPNSYVSLSVSDIRISPPPIIVDIALTLLSVQRNGQDFISDNCQYFRDPNSDIKCKSVAISGII